MNKKNGVVNRIGVDVDWEGVPTEIIVLGEAFMGKISGSIGPQLKELLNLAIKTQAEISEIRGLQDMESKSLYTHAVIMMMGCIQKELMAHDVLGLSVDDLMNTWKLCLIKMKDFLDQSVIVEHTNH